MANRRIDFTYDWTKVWIVRTMMIQLDCAYRVAIFFILIGWTVWFAWAVNYCTFSRSSIKSRAQFAIKKKQNTPNNSELLAIYVLIFWPQAYPVDHVESARTARGEASGRAGSLPSGSWWIADLGPVHRLSAKAAARIDSETSQFRDPADPLHVHLNRQTRRCHFALPTTCSPASAFTGALLLLLLCDQTNAVRNTL